ncbi:hypothetical protein BCR34DRAFT_555843 [Clohesyomyces aquaticus]|uniref:Uncharacterized protein n=1 Tax=Clohesyomyces aquaticus TaxID=1231657 RepID=A0A1Y2A473_9PLEO|nr:hypothetical protein BCR34DRAFT_555843 [Clohesyomyces aquaticus]
MYYASSVQTGSPLPRPTAKYLTTPPPVSLIPPESSIIPGRRSAVSPLISPRLPVTVAPDETVDHARDKYLQEFRQPRLVRHKPSLFLAPFKKKQEKERNRDSSRLSGISFDSRQPRSATNDVTTNDLHPPKKKRSFSNSLRSKFKKVFRKTSGKSTSLPIQQIDASRDYFGDYAPPPRTADSNFEIPSPDLETLQRIRARTSSSDGNHPAMARSSSRSSSRSLHSETDLNHTISSRVTSWSNSSAGNTLTQREIKRLTVIHEAKDSIGSEADQRLISKSPARPPPPIPGFAAFREPIPMEHLVEEVSTPVDPKRVFSALMKEINASNETTQMMTLETPAHDADVFVVSSRREVPSRASEELHSSGSRDCRYSTTRDYRRPSRSYRPNSFAAQSKSSSIKSFTRAIKTTIRTVTPSERPSSPLSEGMSHAENIARNQRPDTAASYLANISDTRRYDEGDDNTRTIRLKQRSWNPLHQQDSGPEKQVLPTPEQIENRVEKSKGRWKTPLEENHIPFFPRSTRRTFNVTNIPRRTFSGKKPYENQAESNLGVEGPRGGNMPTMPHSPRPRLVFSPMSPSIYSRNTDGVSILPNESVQSLEKASVAPEEGGTAVITPSQGVNKFVIGTPSPHRRTNSNRSSKDWRAWLSHEVSELENLPREDFNIHEDYGSTGHTRELTQISADDPTVIIHGTIEISTPKQESEEATPTNQNISRDPAKLKKSSPDSLAPPKRSEDSRTPRRASPRPLPSPATRSHRQSSVVSSNSSLDRTKPESRSSERMNDRFPYIQSGRRRSSNNSARLSYQSRKSLNSPTSGSSSLKATSSPVVYSDFSAPTTQDHPKHTDSLKSKHKESVAMFDKTNPKENIAPSPEKPLPAPADTPSGTSHKSARTLATSDTNRSPSKAASYTTSAAEITSKLARTSSPVPNVSPYVRLRHNSSLATLTSRPKSAYDLRGAITPSPLGFAPSASESPKKLAARQSMSTITRKPVAGKSIEGDPLSMVLESPWCASPSPSSSPKRTSIDTRCRSPLHVKTSSSTLALNKEPSPGHEERNIDSVLGFSSRDEEVNGVPGGVRWRRWGAGSVTPLGRYASTESLRGEGSGTITPSGRVTPGHRLAERFLRERRGGSGAGTPEDDAEVDVGRDRDIYTPAFL